MLLRTSDVSILCRTEHVRKSYLALICFRGGGDTNRMVNFRRMTKRYRESKRRARNPAACQSVRLKSSFISPRNLGEEFPIRWKIVK